MSKESLEQPILTLAVQRVPPSINTAPEPGPKPSGAKAALRRCSAAWQRAFKACMDESGPDEGMADVVAAHEGHLAYCNAMPLFAGREGVRDFIACAAHGILIGAIPPQKSGQLLYAAQVALATLQSEPKPPRSPSE
ncbi:MAG TPA: hypothetical protein VGE83_12130 [Terracidiphilus sp.]|jgi:hypothetical protein